MTAPHYHVGILVLDLDAAVARFSEVLGVGFQVIATGAASRNLSPRVAYSVGVAPFLELMEAGGDGVHAATLGEGIHHIGFSLDDVEGRCRWLEEAGGAGVTTIFVDDDGARTCVFTDPVATHGVRLELVDDGLRAAFEARLASARATSDHPVI